MTWTAQSDYLAGLEAALASGDPSATPGTVVRWLAKLRLLVQGSEVILSAERPAVALGRDASADLVIK